MSLVEQLLLLGLSRNEARAYAALLRVKTAGVAELAEISGLHRPNVYSALHRLTARGLVSEGSGKVKLFSAVSPELVFGDTLEMARSRLAQQNKAVRQLARAYRRRSDSNGTDAFIEVMRTTPEGVSAGFEDCLQSVKRARREVLFLTKSHAPYFTAKTRKALLSRFDRAVFVALRRGVAFRCVYQADFLSDPQEQRRAVGALKAGERARVLKHLPMGLRIVDRRAVWFRPDSLRDTGISFKASDSSTVEVFADAFEYYWARGEELAEYLSRTGSVAPGKD